MLEREKFAITLSEKWLFDCKILWEHKWTSKTAILSQEKYLISQYIIDQMSFITVMVNKQRSTITEKKIINFLNF